MASKLLMLFVPLAAFLFQRLFQPNLRFGDHRDTVYNHVPGTCRPVDGVVHGSEDIVCTRDGFAFISTGLKASPVFNPDPWYLQRKGKILLFNFKNPGEGVRELKIEPEEKLEDLQPHGLSLYENQAGEIRLFVVNHLKDGERVEIFRYVRPEGKLQLIRSVQDPLLYSVNDVVAMGTDAFFATNDHYCRAPWAKKLERILEPAWSNVVYYNGTVASVAADGFFIANSVVTTPSGEVVYVSDSLQQTVKVFRPRADHSLELQRVIHLFTGVDNLNICPDTGDLWVAAHPSVTDLFKHVQDRRHPAPSQVLRIQDPAGASPEVTELYANDGRQLNGSSVAVVYNRRLLIGTVFDTLLYCDVTVPL